MWHLYLKNGSFAGRVMAPHVQGTSRHLVSFLAILSISFNNSIIRPVTRFGELGAVCLHAPVPSKGTSEIQAFTP